MVHVSVLMLTYNRAHLIKYALDGLRKQIYQDFEVLVVLCPSHDGTESILVEYAKYLNIKVFLNPNPLPLTDSYNLGLANCKGKIIAFLDDDAVPEPDWLLNHVRNYRDCRTGGVAGDVITVNPSNMEPTGLHPSQVIFGGKSVFGNIGRIVWACPLPGLENNLVYISKAGTVADETRLFDVASHKKVNSLLAMGCNMSVLAEAVKDMVFPNDVWTVGLGWEQYMGWWIWKKGYATVFEPKLKVKHITHESLSRNIQNMKRRAVNQAESDFLFYMLYGLEKQLSIMTRISWFVFSSANDIKKVCLDRETKRISNIRIRFFSELLGIRWLISRRFGGNCFPRNDLARLN
jgi:glycosyltransferase involved in cell wall biosynthesis